MSCSGSRERISLVRVQGPESRLLDVQSAKALVVGAGMRKFRRVVEGRDSPRLVPRAMRLGGYRGQSPGHGSQGARRLPGRFRCQRGSRGMQRESEASPLPSGRTVSPSMACKAPQHKFQDTTKRAGLWGRVVCGPCSPLRENARRHAFGYDSVWQRAGGIVPQQGGFRRRNHAAFPFSSTSRASFSRIARPSVPPASGCSFFTRRL